MMDPNEGGPIGPPREHLEFLNAEHCLVEVRYFWSMIEAFFASFPEDYDDIPAAFREDGSEQLLHNLPL